MIKFFHKVQSVIANLAKARCGNLIILISKQKDYHVVPIIIGTPRNDNLKINYGKTI